MARYVEFQTGGGESVFIEVEETVSVPDQVGSVGIGGEPSPQVGHVGITDTFGKAVTSAKQSLADAMHVVSANAEAFIAQIGKLSQAPETVEVSFGLKISGDIGGIVVAKASSEANFNIKMVWKAKKSADDSKLDS